MIVPARPSRLALGAIAFAFAGTLLTAQDRVRHTAGVRDVGILVDGDRDGTFRNDEVYRSAEVGGFFDTLFPSIPLGNFTRSDQSNEVIAFATGHAPTLREAVVWSPAGNTVDLELEEEHRIVVHAWITVGSFAFAKQKVIEHSIETSKIWRSERQGVAFERFEIHNAIGRIAGTVGVDCGDVPAIRQAVGAEPGALNVYYVDSVRFDSGITLFGAWFCGTGTDTILMGYGTTGAVLAHEFGHAFSLGHPDSFPSVFDMTNVMWPTVWDDSVFLTEGQTFRSMLHPASALNLLYQSRPGAPQRSCGHRIDPDVAACPPLHQRIWADGSWPATNAPAASVDATPDAAARALDRLLYTSCVVGDEPSLTTQLAPYADSLVPELIRILRDGPGGETIDGQREILTRRWVERSRFLDARPRLGLSAEDHAIADAKTFASDLERRLDEFEMRYRERAAIGLAALRTPEALAALAEARATGDRRLERLIERVLQADSRRVPSTRVSRTAAGRPH